MDGRVEGAADVKGLWSKAAGERKSSGRLSHVGWGCAGVFWRWSRLLGGRYDQWMAMGGGATAGVVAEMLLRGLKNEGLRLRERHVRPGLLAAHYQHPHHPCSP